MTEFERLLAAARNLDPSLMDATNLLVSQGGTLSTLLPHLEAAAAPKEDTQALLAAAASANAESARLVNAQTTERIRVAAETARLAAAETARLAAAETIERMRVAAETARLAAAETLPSVAVGELSGDNPRAAAKIADVEQQDIYEQIDEATFGVGRAVDVAVNEATGGNPGQTLSARSYGTPFATVIDSVAPGHTSRANTADLEREFKLALCSGKVVRDYARKQHKGFCI